VSHYVLGFTSLAADNAASVLGIGLGTALRYIGYKLFVFAERPPVELTADVDAG